MDNPDSTEALAARIIHALERVRENPGLYIIRVNAEGFYDWNSGFASGCALAGASRSADSFVPIYSQVVAEHGWKDSSFGPSQGMKARGLDDAAIVGELILLEIETWKRVYGIP